MKEMRRTAAVIAVVVSMVSVVEYSSVEENNVLATGTTQREPERTTTDDHCSDNPASYKNSSVTWTTPKKAGTVRPAYLLTIQYTLHDGNGVKLCNQNEGLILAKAEGLTWTASTKAGKNGEIPVLLGEGPTLVSVILAFDKITLLRANTDSPECLYKTIEEKAFNLDGYSVQKPELTQHKTFCPPDIASNVLNGLWVNTSSAFRNGTWEWAPIHTTCEMRPVTGRNILFWGDETLQIAVKSLAAEYKRPDPFPGDRKAKFYFSKEVDIRKRYAEIPEPNGANGSLLFLGNTSPSLSGRGKTPCMGLGVMDVESYRNQILDFLRDKSFPDAIVMHSGIADICTEYQMNVKTMESRADAAGKWWAGVIGNKKTKVILMTTAATSGIGVCARFHAPRLMWWDATRNAALRRHLPGDTVVDVFSLTLPFHFTNDYSDGTTYGLHNVRGNQDATPADFPKLSRFLAGKRYNPTVGIMVARLIANAGWVV